MVIKLKSNQVNESHIGKIVNIKGFINKRREHSQVIFLDCRDKYGIVQLVVNPDSGCFSIADKIRSEYVVNAIGKVFLRPEGTENIDHASGKIEVHVEQLEITSKAKSLPFQISDTKNVSEEVKLQWRFLDLRSKEMQEKLQFRSKLSYEVHKYLYENEFSNIETPILTKATPEGARDFLVPSRVNPGKFFALPQSPQIFKQLLMMSGFERYYQIVKCFRDEDLRADRQPEFTQIDLEMSFVEQKDVMQLVEGLCRHMFKTMLNLDFPSELPCLDYKTALTKYGSDRPDLRNPLELQDIDKIFVNSGFSVFADAAKDKHSRVAVIRVPGGAKLSRKQLDEYTKLVCKAGAKGLAYIKVNDISDFKEGLQSPITKFFNEQEINDLLIETKVKNGDILFFGAGKNTTVAATLSVLRDKLGHDLGLIDKSSWSLLWVVNFPMFEVEYDGSGLVKNLKPMHHPFTAPSCNKEELSKAPDLAKSHAYDLVLNGCEIGGGSMRIHDIEMQKYILDLIGFTEEQAKNAFNHLMNGLEHGCPPHGGFAFGLDRLIMLMTKSNSIREVIAFPKTQSAACPLTDAPTKVETDQLDELGLELSDLIET